MDIPLLDIRPTLRARLSPRTFRKIVNWIGIVIMVSAIPVALYFGIFAQDNIEYTVNVEGNALDITNVPKDATMVNMTDIDSETYKTIHDAMGGEKSVTFNEVDEQWERVAAAEYAEIDGKYYSIDSQSSSGAPLFGDLMRGSLYGFGLLIIGFTVPSIIMRIFQRYNIVDAD